MKHAYLIAVGAFSAAVIATGTLPVAGQAATAHGASAPTTVSVRVEGISSTLLAEKKFQSKAISIDRDGNPADACEGDTVAAALQEATHGDWAAGSYYSGLGYSVTGILGESHPFTSDYYWAFWIDNRPATTGICTAKLHAGEHVTFFPQCSQESAAGCPEGNFEPTVLELKGPATARVGDAVTVTVSSLANLTGKASPGSGVKVRAGGHTVTTGGSGRAKLTFAHPGTYRIVASATDSIRDELTVKVSS